VVKDLLLSGSIRFIIRRALITVLTLFLVSLLTFAAFALIPGDPALLALGVEATPEQVAALRVEMGLDRSLPLRYVSWLAAFLTGNMGNSSRFRGAAVSGLILERLPVTVTLAGLSLAFALLIAIPVTLFSVRKENGIIDRITTALTAITISFPGFFLGVLFIWLFGLILKCFVPGAYVSYTESLSGFLRYLFFPALVIAIPNAAVMIKFLRASFFHELKSEYVRTARSKGNPWRRILRVHVLRNAVIPAVTLLGMIVGEVFSGSIVIEQVFVIPGIGKLLITAIGARDYSVVQTLAVYIAFIVVLANTCADIAIRLIDPRIRRS
jgi:ABC-type dipeptide/oligopeptide/nickel transport system permease component